VVWPLLMRYLRSLAHQGVQKRFRTVLLPQDSGVSGYRFSSWFVLASRVINSSLLVEVGSGFSSLSKVQYRVSLRGVRGSVRHPSRKPSESWPVPLGAKTSFLRDLTLFVPMLLAGGLLKFLPLLNLAAGVC